MKIDDIWLSLIESFTRQQRLIRHSILFFNFMHINRSSHERFINFKD